MKVKVYKYNEMDNFMKFLKIDSRRGRNHNKYRQMKIGTKPKFTLKVNKLWTIAEQVEISPNIYPSPLWTKIFKGL